MYSTKDKGPCYNCDNRTAGCHGSCIKYMDWKQRQEALNNAINEQKAKEGMIYADLKKRQRNYGRGKRVR